VVCLAIILIVIFCLCRWQESCCVEEVEIKGGHQEIIMVDPGRVVTEHVIIHENQFDNNGGYNGHLNAPPQPFTNEIYAH